MYIKFIRDFFYDNFIKEKFAAHLYDNIFFQSGPAVTARRGAACLLDRRFLLGVISDRIYFASAHQAHEFHQDGGMIENIRIVLHGNSDSRITWLRRGERSGSYPQHVSAFKQQDRF